MVCLLSLIVLKGLLRLINMRFFFIFCSLFFSVNYSVFAQVETTSTDIKATTVDTHHTALKRKYPNERFVFDVFYKGISVGQMKQEYHWTGNNVAVDSAADFSFLLFSFGGSQQSDIYWDVAKQAFMTRSFVRESSGFSTVKMTANFDKTGQHSTIVNNGESSEYSNEEGHIVDFNAINLQISQGLKTGKKEFEFYMQTSDDIAHYYFELKGKETINTKFGEIEAYRVQQTRKKDRIFNAWFAPLFDYQMVKFAYQRKVLDIEGELVGYTKDF
jgi:hypothetical protein